MTKMYHLCLLEPALFRFLHDAPRSELLIDLPLSFFMTLRGHLASEGEYYSRTKQQGSGVEGRTNPSPDSVHFYGNLRVFSKKRKLFCLVDSNVALFWGQQQQKSILKLLMD